MARKSKDKDSGELAVRQKEELQTGEGTREGMYFKPDVDIYETEDALTLLADVPGTVDDNIEIDLRDNLLTVTAAVRDVEDRWKPLYTEYQSGHFMRQFRLGQNLDQSKITAELENGVLRLMLPKSENAVPRKIKVTTS